MAVPFYENWVVQQRVVCSVLLSHYCEHSQHLYLKLFFVNNFIFRLE